MRQAIEARKGAVQQLRQDGDRGELALALRDLGELERRLPDAEAAREHYEEAVAISVRSASRLRLAHTVRHLGDVHHDAGRAAQAEPCYHEALVLYRGHSQLPALDLANAIRSLAVLKGGGRRDGHGETSVAGGPLSLRRGGRGAGGRRMRRPARTAGG